MKDLVCLVADKNMEAALSRLLRRPEALRISHLAFDVLVHPRRDPGCFHEGAAFLAERRAGYAHGLVLLDHAWEGASDRSSGSIEAALNKELERRGLMGWAGAVVIEPELEAWVFSESPHVETCLGWMGRRSSLRQWLEGKSLWATDAAKPADPKRAVETVLAEVRLPRSSAIYGELASKVSVERCVDPAFGRLCGLLREWFGAGHNDLVFPIAGCRGQGGGAAGGGAR